MVRVSDPARTSALVVGEAVAADVVLARVPSRLIAFLIDFVVEVIVFAVALWLGAFLVTDVALARTVVIAVAATAFLGYPVTAETLWGRTLGKWALGLRVVRDDGGPIGFRHALARGLAGVFLERPGVTLGVAAIVTSFVSRRGKRVGDLLAGTVVLHERLPRGRRDLLPPVASELTAWAAGADLRAVDDRWANEAWHILGRRHELSVTAGASLATALIGRIAPAVRPAPPPADPMAVVAAIVVERRRQVSAPRAPSSPTAAPPDAASPLPPPPPSAPLPASRLTRDGGFVPPS